MAILKTSKGKNTAQLGIASFQYEQRPDGSCYWTHIPLKVQPGQPPKWEPIWCAGFDLDDKGQKHYHHIEGIPCHCPPGPQIIAIQHTAFEVACIGGRGSAKSEGTFGFLTKGNPIYDPTAGVKGVDASYLASPNYRFLVLRENYKDLLDYFERAKDFFGHFGATASDNILKFPSGARGVFDHLADAEAYKKYQGQEFCRITVEEGTQIPSEDLYLKVMMSCRSSREELRPQIMITANPGGPGARWFNRRFIDLKTPNGRALRLGETYSDPDIDDPLRSTRVAIHSTVDDNPYLLRTGYDKQLEHLKKTQPTLYKRWRHGDMHAIEGAFFEMFREHRLEGEPPNALHVVKPIRLDDYWPRAIGVDWGYSHPSAVYWGCWHPGGQLHIYRELVTTRMGAVQLGAEIAKRSLEDLQRMPNPHMTLYLSHDAFARTNETATEAEQIAQGIDMILGRDSAFVLTQTEEEKLLENEASWASVLRRQSERKVRTHITVANAGVQRTGNMNRIREYMRWDAITVDGMDFDEQIARNILLAEGAMAYHEYRRKCEKPKDETLPKLQIHDGCDKLIRAIEAAVEDDKNSEKMAKQDGDDPVDALAYLVGNFEFRGADEPADRILVAKLAALRTNIPGLSTQSLIMAARREEAVAKKSETPAAYMIPRRGMRRGLRVN